MSARPDTMSVNDGNTRITYRAIENMREAHITPVGEREYYLYQSIPGGQPWLLWMGQRITIDAPDRFGYWETREQWRDWVRRFVTNDRAGK